MKRFDSFDSGYDEEEYRKHISCFPDLYCGDGTIFRAVDEIIRLADRLENKKESTELLLAAKDIQAELLRNMTLNLLDSDAKITFNIGRTSEKHYYDMVNGLAPIYYIRNKDPKYLYPEGM